MAIGVGLGVKLGAVAGVTAANGVGAGEADEAATGGAGGADALVLVPEQPAATTRIEMDKAASLRDASIVSPSPVTTPEVVRWGRMASRCPPLTRLMPARSWRAAPRASRRTTAAPSLEDLDRGDAGSQSPPT
jgi:hypothetical protein